MRARTKASLFGAALLVAASMAVAAPAHAAAAVCAGTQSTVVVCVDPTGQTFYDDCIWWQSYPDCEYRITVRGPTVYCSGSLLQC